MPTHQTPHPEDIEPTLDAAQSDDETPLDDESLLTQDETDELAGQELRFKVGSNLKFRRLDKFLTGDSSFQPDAAAETHSRTGR
jgi:hypothetical protein